MKKVFWLGLALVLTMGLLAVGCGDSEDIISGDEFEEFNWRNYEGESLNLMLVTHTWTDATINRLHEFTELTGIEISFDTLPEEEYFNKLTTLLAGGSSEYDIFMTGAQQIWEYAPGDWMEPLDDYIANPVLTSEDYDVDDFLPSMIAAGRWNRETGNPVGTGTTWALPWVSHGSAIFYRTDIFEKHDIEPPTNLEELYDVVVKLKAAEPDMYPLAVRGTRSWATMHTSVLSWFSSYGGTDFDSDLNCTVNASPEVVEAHELWGKILREGGPPSYASMTWYEVFSDFVGGKAIMGYDADVLGFFIHQPGNDEVYGKMAWIEPPGKPGGDNASALWVWLMAMNANSNNKGPAWYFLQWVTGKDHLTDAAVNDVLVNPVRQSIWENPAFENAFANHPNYYDVFQSTTANSGLFYTPQRNFFEFTAEWAAAIQKIAANQASAEEALEEVVNTVDSLRR